MKVSLKPVLNDSHLDAERSSSQRQLELSIAAIPGQQGRLPLNLCLVLDHSGSMNGQPLETVKQAAINLVDKLSPQDRLSVVAFDHRAKVLIPNQTVENVAKVKEEIKKLKADGGTAIDEGLKSGIDQIAQGKSNTTSQIFLLTDGENEHGDNDRCLKFAKFASEANITLNTLGFGNHWNQDVLEKISDSANGTLCYIEQPSKAIEQFEFLFNRIQSVGLTNAHLLLSLMPGVRLAELKPIAQVLPDAIELPVQQEGNKFVVRLGDLMTDAPRVILATIYINKLPLGLQNVAITQVRYDDPAISQQRLLSEEVPVQIEVQSAYEPQINDKVQKSGLALAKYRQTQMAETRLQQGDRSGAATLLQTAAKTALQMGDQGAATVLQNSATRLEAGEELSEAERKKTRIVSKTILQ